MISPSVLYISWNETGRLGRQQLFHCGRKNKNNIIHLNPDWFYKNNSCVFESRVLIYVYGNELSNIDN